MVLGVGTVIKVYNRTALMAIRLGELIFLGSRVRPWVPLRTMKKGVGGLESAGD